MIRYRMLSRVFTLVLVLGIMLVTWGLGLWH